VSVLSGCLRILYEINKHFSTNSYLTTRHLKHSPDFESVENIGSSNVVEFEYKLRHIRTEEAHWSVVHW